MSTGLYLLRAVLENERDLSAISTAGISRDFFDERERTIYEFAAKHLNQHGSLPSLETVQRHTKVAFPAAPPEPLSYWVKATLDRHHSGLMATASNKTRKLLMAGKTEEARRVFQETAELLAQQDGTHASPGLVTFAEIMAMAPDTTPPLIKGVLYEREPLLITGSAGLGKSLMIMHLALALAGGSDALQTYETGRARRVLLIQSEVVFRSFQERLSRMTHDWSGRRVKALGNIFSPWLNGSPQLAGALTDPYGKPTPLLADIKRLIEKTEPEVVIFDPLISYTAAQENDNSAMRAMLDSLTGLSAEYGMSLILTHHHGKSKEHHSYNKARGASAITDWAAAILTLTGSNAKGSDAHRHLIKATWTKTRSFRLPGPILLELVQGSTFNLVDQRADEIGPQDVFEVLRKAGGQLNDRKKLIALIREQTGASRDNARRAFKQAIKDKLIVSEQDQEDKRRNKYRLATDSSESIDIENLL